MRVIKLGGSALDELEPILDFVEKFSDEPLLLVHGGGPQISALLKSLGHQASFHEGLRVTDELTLEAVKMVLAGSVNKTLVQALSNRGLKAVGLCGVDGQTLKAPLKEDGALGAVGSFPEVDVTLLETLTGNGFVPVLAPVCSGFDGQILNVNADTTTAAVAAALGADELIFLTDVEGVLDGQGDLVSSLDEKMANDFQASGVFSLGMLPKIEAALLASKMGVTKVRIRGIGESVGTSVEDKSYV